MEVLVAAGMLLGIAVSWGAFVRNVSAKSKKGRFDVHLAKEHKAILGLVSSIPRHAVNTKACVFLPNLPATAFAGEDDPLGAFHPHPYRFVHPASDQCTFRGNPLKPNGSNNPLPAPEYIPATRALYDLIWEWPTRGNHYIGNSLNNSLDPTFASTLANAAQLAGCTVCHDGVGGASKGTGGASQVPDWIKPCNFGNANHWLDTATCAGPFPPGRAVTSRNMLASRMGQLFLPDENVTPRAWQLMNQYFQNFLLNRQQPGLAGAGLTLLSYGNALNSFVRFESPFVTTAGGTVSFRGPLQSAACGSLCVAPEVLDTLSCVDVCTNIDTDTGRCSCPGKDCWQPCPPKCTAKVKQYRCATQGVASVQVPRVSVSTGAINPDPSFPAAVLSVSSATVPR